MSSSYDPNNIFAKILEGNIPSSEVGQTDTTYSFEDINPQAETHSLVIPKGAYADLTAFAEQGSDKELADWVRALVDTAKAKNIDQSGYRIIVNCGDHGHQEVPHLHGHVLGGHPLGPMLTRRSS